MSETIRERIGEGRDKTDDWELRVQWLDGNLIPVDEPLELAKALQACFKDIDPDGVRVPADEVGARIEAAIAEAAREERALGSALDTVIEVVENTPERTIEAAYPGGSGTGYAMKHTMIAVLRSLRNSARTEAGEDG